MNHYEAVNILDMLNAIGEDAVKNILSDFSCPKNFENIGVQGVQTR